MAKKKKRFLVHTLERYHYTYVVYGDANETPETIQRKYESLNLASKQSIKTNGPVVGYLESSWVDKVDLDDLTHVEFE